MVVVAYYLWRYLLLDAMSVQGYKSLHDPEADLLGEVQAFHIFVIGAKFKLQLGVPLLQTCSKAEHRSVHQRAYSIALVAFVHPKSLKPQYVVRKKC